MNYSPFHIKNSFHVCHRFYHYLDIDRKWINLQEIDVVDEMITFLKNNNEELCIYKNTLSDTEWNNFFDKADGLFAYKIQAIPTIYDEAFFVCLFPRKIKEEIPSTEIVRLSRIVHEYSEREYHVHNTDGGHDEIEVKVHYSIISNRDITQELTVSEIKIINFITNSFEKKEDFIEDYWGIPSYSPDDLIENVSESNDYFMRLLVEKLNENSRREKLGRKYEIGSILFNPSYDKFYFYSKFYSRPYRDCDCLRYLELYYPPNISWIIEEKWRRVENRYDPTEKEWIIPRY